MNNPYIRMFSIMFAIILLIVSNIYPQQFTQPFSIDGIETHPDHPNKQVVQTSHPESEEVQILKIVLGVFTPIIDAGNSLANKGNFGVFLAFILYMSVFGVFMFIIFLAYKLWRHRQRMRAKSLEIPQELYKFLEDQFEGLDTKFKHEFRDAQAKVQAMVIKRYLRKQDINMILKLALENNCNKMKESIRLTKTTIFNHIGNREKLVTLISPIVEQNKSSFVYYIDDIPTKNGYLYEQCRPDIDEMYNDIKFKIVEIVESTASQNNEEFYHTLENRLMERTSSFRIKIMDTNTF